MACERLIYAFYRGGQAGSESLIAAVMIPRETLLFRKRGETVSENVVQSI